MYFRRFLLEKAKKMCYNDRTTITIVSNERNIAMKEKEIAQIRRRYRSDKINISRICGCYVNSKKEIISEFDQSLGMMSEDDANGMLGLLKKTLSGHIGTNLLEIEFSTHQVSQSEEYSLLSKLKATELKDTEARAELYKKIIENLEFEGSYLILLAHDNYDVFDICADGMKSEESTTVYSYVICAVCPVKEGKASMSYYFPEKCFRTVCADTVLSRPEIGFVFPVLEDGLTNIYKAAYYTKNLENNYSELVNALFAKEAPMPAKEQKQTFGEVLEQTVGEECSLHLVSSIHAQINEIIEENKAEKEEELPFINKDDAAQMLRFCGVSEDKIEAFEKGFDESFGENAEIPSSNLAGTKQLQIETPEVSVKVSGGCSNVVQSRVIDGVKYILIRADNDVTVNGVSVKI